MLKKTLFLHIQKTAGSGLVETLRRAYGSESLTSHGDYLKAVSHFPMVDRFAVDQKTLESYHAMDVLTGHFGAAFAKPYLTNRYSFTFLRDPWERILSFYFFCRSRDPQEFSIYKICHDLTLKQFLDAADHDQQIRNFIYNNQTWQIFCGFGNLQNSLVDDFAPGEILQGAKENIKLFDHVGLVEYFNEDRETILRSLGIFRVESPRTVNASPERPRWKNLDDETKRALERMTDLDRELYDHVKKQRRSVNEGLMHSTIDVKNLALIQTFHPGSA